MRNMSFQKGLVKNARLIAQHSLQNWKEVVITGWAGELRNGGMAVTGDRQVILHHQEFQ
jgi:hypothetical protein